MTFTKSIVLLLAALPSMAQAASDPPQQVAANVSPLQREPSTRPVSFTGVTAVAAAHMRLLLQQIATFEQEKQRWPADLEEVVASGLIPDGGKFELRNPKTEQERGFIYVKPESPRLWELKSPDKTPILYEAAEGKPDTTGLIGYADGHVTPAGEAPAGQ